MKYLSLFTSLSLLLTFQFLPAQAPDTIWTKTYGGMGDDFGHYIEVTSDSGFIIVGTTTSFGSGWSDIWLVRIDSSGDTLWTKTYGGIDEEYCYAVRETSDGNYILAGWIEYLGIVSSDIILIKVDNDGDTLWTGIYDMHEREEAYHVLSLDEGGYIISGMAYNGFPTAHDYLVLRVNSEGDTLWSKEYGGLTWDGDCMISETSEKGFIITGSTMPHEFNIDCWTVRTDSLGDTLWTRKYGGNDEEWGMITHEVSPNRYITAGTTDHTGSGGDDFWLFEIDSLGGVLWSKTYGGNGTDRLHSMQKTSDGGYILVGYTRSYGSGSSDMYVVKTDHAGDTLWTKALGGSGAEHAWPVKESPYGGYIIAGYTTSYGLGGTEMWIVQLAPDPVSLIRKVRGSLPSNYQLTQNYPNPFNPITTMEFDLPKTSEVTIKIFNILGEEVATLLSAFLLSGSHSVKWDASKFASGIYLYRIEAGEYVETRKMVLMK